MAFHEVRLPDLIGRGLVSGPSRRVQIKSVGSGNEGRAVTWADSRRQYDLSYGVRRADDLAAIVGFFEARNGPLYGFRLKDWADYRSGPPGTVPTATDQVIGTGDGASDEFQLVKAYGPAAIGYTRTIDKPVSDTVVIALDGVEQASGWTVDVTTGLVTFDTAPAEDVEITAGFEFDVPVRFAQDELDLELDIERLGSIPAIPLVEIRL